MRLTCRSVRPSRQRGQRRSAARASAARTSAPSRSSPSTVRRVTSTPSAASVTALPADVPPSPSWWRLGEQRLRGVPGQGGEPDQRVPGGGTVDQATRPPSSALRRRRAQTSCQSDGTTPSTTSTDASSTSAPVGEHHRSRAEVGDDEHRPVGERDDVVAVARRPTPGRPSRGRRPGAARAPTGRSRTSTRRRRAARRARTTPSAPAAAARSRRSARSRTRARSAAHGSGTRQPSRPRSAPARAEERRVLAQVVVERGVVGQPELLALVQVGRAGQAEHEQRRGTGPAQAERLVGLLVAVRRCRWGASPARPARAGTRAGRRRGWTAPRWSARRRRRRSRTTPRSPRRSAGASQCVARNAKLNACCISSGRT